MKLEPQLNSDAYSSSTSALPAARCIVCGTLQWQRLWDVLLRCPGCGFIRAADLPPPHVAAQIYTSQYFSGQEYGDYISTREVHRRNFAARWRDMRRLAGPIASVYEVGCAYGLWLEYMSEQHVRSEGIDVCVDAVHYAVETLGQRAMAGDFLTARIERDAFQAFCMWDTIEHLPHPQAVVSRARELLPRAGWLFLTTGDIGSLSARLRGRHWRMIHPPTHLQYFSRSTMRSFLERQGFHLVEIRSVPTYRTLQSSLSSMIAMGKGLPAKVASWLHAALPTAVQDRIGAWTNLGDIMFVAARKPTSCRPCRPAGSP